MPVFEVTLRLGLVGDDVNEDGVRSIMARTLDTDGRYWSRNIVDVKRTNFKPPWWFDLKDDGGYALHYDCEYTSGLLDKTQTVPIGMVYSRERAAEIVETLNEAEHQKWRDTYGEASL